MQTTETAAERETATGGGAGFLLLKITIYAQNVAGSGFWKWQKDSFGNDSGNDICTLEVEKPAKMEAGKH